MVLLFLILLLKEVGSKMLGESDIQPTYQPEDPSPTIPTNRQKEHKGKNSRRLMPIKNIGPALETRQSHTIEYGANNIVPEGY